MKVNNGGSERRKGRKRRKEEGFEEEEKDKKIKVEKYGSSWRSIKFSVVLPVSKEWSGSVLEGSERVLHCQTRDVLLLF